MIGLPHDRFLIRLRLAAAASFHFVHGSVVRGLLARALGQHELPDGLVPFACESGKVTVGAGEPYHIGVTLVGEARRLTEPLRRGLEACGRGDELTGGPPPTLGGNFEVERMEPVPALEVAAGVAALAGRARLTLHLLSPLRLERPEELKRKGAGYLNQDCFPLDHFLSRLWNRLFLLRHGRYPTAEERSAQAPASAADAVATPQGLLWLDLPVSGAPEKRRSYTLGGVVGQVLLAGVPETWLETLVAGQAIHAGANVAFGFGAYTLSDLATPAALPFQPATTYLARAARTEVLREALHHVLESSEAEGLDEGEVGGGAAEDLDEDLLMAGLATLLGSRDYRASHLTGCLLPKKDGGARPLAIPSLRDRVLSRAAAAVLAPAVDTLLEDSSYAYRKGLSRAGAARAIQTAYEDGYRWVLDADIRSFFDSVPWARLFAKLDALFPFEPLVGLICQWVEAPVHFAGREIRRLGGLPQGSPISPLLANLYLDELDEELLGKDYRLVRYADDFVVLTRDLEAARQARKDAQAALTDLGLGLNEDDTAVRSLEAGFTYLGYLFCRSLVVEATEEDEEAGDEPPELDPADIPADSWLAQVPFTELRSLVEREEPGRRGRRRPVSLVPLAGPYAGGAHSRRPLYVSSPHARLALDNSMVVVEVDGVEVERAPVRSLSHAVLVGHTRASLPLLLSMSRLGVPAYFCHRSGELYATFEPRAPDWHLWLQQARLADDEAACARFAADVVAAKLHNMATLAVRFGWQRSAELATTLRELERGTRNKTEIPTLLGLEGRGTSLFLGSLADSLPPGWGFAGRNRHPPRDPVNAMLSFGYTLLHNHLSTALEAAGLNPRLGLFHQPRGAHHALASDLQEEARWLVEGLVWSLVRRHEISPDDFGPHGRFPCLLSADARGRFITALERRLHTAFTPPDDEPMTYLAFLARQATRIRALVSGEIARYEPLRLHA